MQPALEWSDRVLQGEAASKFSKAWETLQGEGADATGREQQSARAAHNRLRSSHSDPLSAMNALIAYQAAPNPAQFCS